MHKSSQAIRDRLLAARLPAMPQILFKLIGLCQKDEVGMGEMAELVSRDVGITTKVMNVANSAAYSRGGSRVGLLPSLSKLGIEMIKTLVISESVFQTFSKFSHAKNIDLHGFWIHSLKAAVIAREIAKEMSYPHSEEAYLAGLLHDVGRLALLSAAPEVYSPNFLMEDDEHLCSKEMELMGVTHPEIGAWLIERWNLDSFLADSVLYHHEPIPRLKSAHPLVRIVCLAHLLSCYKSDSPAIESASALCGITPPVLESILVEASAQIKTAATYLGIDLTELDQSPPSAEYEPPQPAGNQADAMLAEEVRDMALVSLAGQSFSHMRSDKELLQSIIRTAAILFNFDDMAVLLQNGDTLALTGIPIGDHQQRLAEFSIPLTDGEIIAGSVLKRQVTFVDRSDKSLGIAEEQLFRVMGTECLVCLPLIAGQLFGVLVGGLSFYQSAELSGRERFLQSFAEQAAVALETFAVARSGMDGRIASLNETHLEALRRIAHEVNNPLAIIKNYLATLDDRLAMHQPVSEELLILNEEIDRVGRIINRFVEQENAPEAAASQGDIPQEAMLREEKSEVNGILNDIVRLFTVSRFLPASVSITVKTTDQPVEMAGSADRLRQILMNLIKNAIEALPKGGKIQVRNNGRIVRDGRAYIELCVSDNGVGLPDDVLAHLFLPVRSSKRGESRGLGLSIVHGLVTEINGSISCRSGETGTTFEILLPAAAGFNNSEPARLADTA